MKHRRGILILSALGLGLVAVARTARAQTPAVRLDSARALVRIGEYDSATAWLNPVFQDPSSTQAQRGRAFLLSASALFMKENLTLTPQARSMLRFALQADSSVRVEPELETDVPGIREHVETLRRELYPPLTARPAAPVVEALTVNPAMLTDTTLPAVNTSFPIAPRPSRAARAIAAVLRADARAVEIWRDTAEAADSTRPLVWNLRGRDGAIVPEGLYAVQVWAQEPGTGVLSATVERTLHVSRLAADTQPLPPPLQPSAFAPETLRLRHGSPGAVLVGAALGAAAAVLPTAFGRTELNQGLAGDQTAYAVAASVGVAGLVGYLGGHRARYSPENVQRNAELRRTDAARRAAVAAANAEARANAPVRVRLERSGP